MKLLFIILVINSLSFNAGTRMVRLPASDFVIPISPEISGEAYQIKVKIPQNLTTTERLELIDLYLCFKVKATLDRPIDWTYRNGMPVNRGILDIMNDWMNRKDKSENMIELLSDLERGEILTLEDMEFYIQEYCKHFGLGLSNFTTGETTAYSNFTRLAENVFEKFITVDKLMPFLEEIEIEIPERLKTDKAKYNFVNRFLLRYLINTNNLEKPRGKVTVQRNGRNVIEHIELKANEIRKNWRNREDESEQMQNLLSELAQGKPLTLEDIKFYVREYCQHFDLQFDLQDDYIFTKRANEIFIEIAKETQNILPIATSNAGNLLFLYRRLSVGN